MWVWENSAWISEEKNKNKTFKANKKKYWKKKKKGSEGKNYLQIYVQRHLWVCQLLSQK